MTIKISALGTITTISGNVIIPMVSNIAGTLTNVKGNIQQVSDWIVENSLSVINSNIANLIADTTSLEANAGVQASQIIALQSDVSTLYSNAAVQSGDIAELYSNAAVQSGLIADLQANAAVQAGLIAELGGVDVNGLIINLAATTSNVTVLQGNIVTIEGNLQAVAINSAVTWSTLSALQNTVAAFDIDSINTDIGVLTTKVNDAEANIIIQYNLLSNVTAAVASYSPNVQVAAYLPIYSGNIAANFITANNVSASALTAPNATVTASTTATSTTTGALRVTGGVGIGGNLHVGQNLVLTGNLTVNGTTTTINATTLDVADVNITLARNATNATQANGAGISVAGALANITYASATDTWNIGKPIVATISSLSANQSNITTLGNLTSLSANGTIQTTGIVYGNTGISGPHIDANLYLPSATTVHFNQTSLSFAPTNVTSANLVAAATNITFGGTSGVANIRVANIYLPNMSTMYSGQAAVALMPFNVVSANLFAAATNITFGATTGVANLRVANVYLPNATTIYTGQAGGVNLLNENASGINAFGAATQVTIGATTGTANIRNANIYFPNATTIFSGQTTLDIANTNVTTMGIGGATTVLNLGGTAGNVNVLGGLSVVSTVAASSTTTGALRVSGGLGVAGNLFADNLTATNLTGTLATAAQPGVTSLGNLTSLSASGTIQTTGIVYGNSGIGGTLLTASQTNITAVGNLTSLSASGTIQTTGRVYGNSGIGGTLLTASQTNITAVGNLTSLSASGVIRTTGVVYANSTASSTTSTTGALVVAGGVGIGGNVTTAGNIRAQQGWGGTLSSAGALGGVPMAFQVERSGTGSGNTWMSYGNGATTIKGTRMPFAGRIVTATLHGSNIAGNINVQASVNGVNSAAYSLAAVNNVVGTDVNVTSDYQTATPLAFAAGDVINYWIAEAPTTANGYVVSFFVRFD